jgi:hypothetical protein
MQSARRKTHGKRRDFALFLSALSPYDSPFHPGYAFQEPAAAGAIVTGIVSNSLGASFIVHTPALGHLFSD